MPYYGELSDLKRAGRNIVSVEIIFPVLVIVVSTAYVATCLLVLHSPLPDIFNLSGDDHLLLLTCVILIYGTIDLVFGLFLCIGVSKLSSAACVSWIFCQFILLISLVCVIFLFPYFTLSLAYIFWELICCTVLLLTFKVYRFHVVHMLRLEIRLEGIVWKQQSSIYE